MVHFLFGFSLMVLYRYQIYNNFFTEKGSFPGKICSLQDPIPPESWTAEYFQNRDF
jgi:hypothetical protein